MTNPRVEATAEAMRNAYYDYLNAVPEGPSRDWNQWLHMARAVLDEDYAGEYEVKHHLKIIGKQYGKASNTIRVLRGEIALLREQLKEVRRGA